MPPLSQKRKAKGEKMIHKTYRDLQSQAGGRPSRSLHRMCFLKIMALTHVPHTHQVPAGTLQAPPGVSPLSHQTNVPGSARTLYSVISTHRSAKTETGIISTFSQVFTHKMQQLTPVHSSDTLSADLRPRFMPFSMWSFYIRRVNISETVLTGCHDPSRRVGQCTLLPTVRVS